MKTRSSPSADDPSDAMRAALERRLGDSTADELASVPPLIPDHELLRRIGRGAYGDVWMARSALGTLRAVKVVYRARFKEDRPYDREFQGILKYEPVSRTHEGLVQVLHVGRNDAAACFYYVMELADDGQESGGKARESGKANASRLTPDSCSLPPGYTPRTLRADLARHQRLPPADAASLVLGLAAALQHLHAHRLVHRDIKPSNVIFVGGQPKLADIGLVTDVGSSQSFVGTEGFIPPEGPGTPQADIYGLGKLLYELATGRDRMDFPQLPAGVAQLPHGEALLELNEVMTRACAPEPQQRYATATELQAELNLFLAGRSLRRARHMERHLARFKKLAAGACVFLALAAVALWFSRREERLARDRAREANDHARAEATLRQRAESAEQESRQQLYLALLEQARAVVRSGELGQRVRALDALRRAAALSNSVELRREVFGAMALPDLRFERELPFGEGFTLRSLDPSFARIAVCRRSGPVEIRSLSGDRVLATLPASTNRPAFIGLWSPDGRFLAVKRDHDGGGQRADWEVWDAEGTRQILLLRDVSWNAAAYHPHQPLFAVGLSSGAIAWWDLTDAREIARLQMAGPLSRLVISPDGGRFAVAQPLGAAWLLSVHEATNGLPLASHLFPDFVSHLDWHPDGRWIAVSDYGTSVHLVEAATGEVRTLGRHKAEVARVAFSPDGRYLFSAGWEREFICWDARAMRRAFSMSLGSYVLQLRSDGRACAVATDKGVQLHTFEPPSGHREFTEDLGGRLSHAAFSSDGHWLAASGGKHLGVWNLRAEAPAALTNATSDTRLHFSAHGELFANRRGDAFRWRVTEGVDVGAPPNLVSLDLAVPPGFVSLCLVSNGVVLTGSRGSRLAGFDQLAAHEGAWKRTPDGLNGISPDGRWLAMFRSYTPHLYVYRLPGLELEAKLTNAANIARFQFSPRGDEVAVASGGGVEFWSTATWQRTRSAPGFRGILYMPDARAFWLIRNLRTAGLYDAHTLEPLLALPAGTLPLAISADGRLLAVSVDARRLQVWDLAELREPFRELGLDWAGGRSSVRSNR